jgi:hypothetical protein
MFITLFISTTDRMWEISGNIVMDMNNVMLYTLSWKRIAYYIIHDVFLCVDFLVCSVDHSIYCKLCYCHYLLHMYISNLEMCLCTRFAWVVCCAFYMSFWWSPRCPKIQESVSWVAAKSHTDTSSGLYNCHRTQQQSTSSPPLPLGQGWRHGIRDERLTTWVSLGWKKSQLSGKLGPKHPLWLSDWSSLSCLLWLQAPPLINKPAMLFLHRPNIWINQLWLSDSAFVYCHQMCRLPTHDEHFVSMMPKLRGLVASEA